MGEKRMVMGEKVFYEPGRAAVRVPMVLRESDDAELVGVCCSYRRGGGDNSSYFHSEFETSVSRC